MIAIWSALALAGLISKARGQADPDAPVPGQALDAELRRRQAEHPGASQEGEGDALQPVPKLPPGAIWVGPRPGELPEDKRALPPGPGASVREREEYWAKAPLPPLEPPPGLEHKRPLSEAQRRKKRFQKPFSVIGVPQLGGNPDSGVIVGAVSALTWYGEARQDPYYDYAPFERQLIVEANVGLKRKPNVLGRQHYLLRYTEPYVADTLLSLVVDAGFVMDANAQYFGNDASTMGSLDEIGPDDLPGNGFATYRDYQRALRQVSEDGTTYAAYHNFQYQQPELQTTARLDLVGGILIPAATLRLAHVFVNRYGGKTVRGDGGRGESLLTKLDEDCASGVATVCNGDWDNTLKVSLMLELRDFPLDPDQGAMVDLSFEAGPQFLGSPGYWRTTGTLALYWSPLETFFGLDGQWARLVLAGRLLYSVQGGDTPFYARNRLSFSDRTVPALGGINTLRGYRLNRFVGDVMTLVNLELRYDLFFARTKRSTINFKLVPFFDSGRVWDGLSDVSLRGYRHNGGVGVYLQWNQSNIIRGDLGVGDEGVSGGVSFGLLF